MDSTVFSHVTPTERLQEINFIRIMPNIRKSENFILKNQEVYGAAKNNHKYTFPNIFSLFFKVLFVQLLSPFRVSHDPKNDEEGSSILTPFLPQKILCGITHPAIVLIYLLMARKTFSASNIKQNPEDMYQLFHVFCETASIILFFFVMWIWRVPLQTLLNKLHAAVQCSKRWETMAKLGIFIYQLFLVISVLQNRLGTLNIFDGNWWKEYYAIATDAFFISPSSTLNSSTVFSDVPPLEQFAIVLCVFADIQTAFIANYTHVIIFVGSIVCFKVVALFSQSIGGVLEEDVDVRTALFIRMKQQIQLLNDFVGPFFLLSLMDGLIFFSTLIGRPETCGPGGSCTIRLITYGLVLLSFGIAAEAQWKISVLRRTVIASSFQSGSRLSPTEVAILLKNGEGDNGLMGWKFFTISHSFLGSVVSLCLTYGLVLLQFVATPSASKP